ncbi:5-oxoprolinase subunit PxpA [Flavobacteriaceae bacterium]|nr:5-oxoprolinase subunit PxpA [Flavobacteriaceae bacterium]
MTKNRIDFNADLGEGFLFDQELMQYISSCNIACGGHTGNENSMRATLALAKQNKVTVGAHPSYPDPANFGRKPMDIDLDVLEQSIYFQVAELLRISKEENIKVAYIKPHGALYNKAAVCKETAKVIIKVLNLLEADLALMGLPNSELEILAIENNITFIKESFADRRYHATGKLVSRNNARAVIHSKEEVWGQLKPILENGKAISLEGEQFSLITDSICFHGDTPEALELVSYVHAQLLAVNYTIKSSLCS